jgi:succinate-semialdehyde dehydrogenase/glutarate-semialdehyde dehydrogenase
MARQGFFFEPTVLADIPSSARVMNEEPFGPIALLNPFDDFDTVIREANRLPFGLAAFGFTNDSRRVNLLGERIEAGMIGLNSFQISMPNRRWRRQGERARQRGGHRGTGGLPRHQVHHAVESGVSHGEDHRMTRYETSAACAFDSTGA